MHYNAKNDKEKKYRVFLGRKMINDAVEANDKEGWVRTETNIFSFYTGQLINVKKETFWGKVFIVRFEE